MKTENWITAWRNIPNELRMLSIGFGILFFGTGAVQQYIGIWFAERGVPTAGPTGLLLLYLAFLAAGAITYPVIVRLGERNCLVMATAVYSAFIVALITLPTWGFYVAAILCGVAAAVLWAAQTNVLNSPVDDGVRAQASAVFWVVYPLGTGLGTFAMGALMQSFSTAVTFAIFAVISVVAALPFLRISRETHPIPAKQPKARISLFLNGTLLAYCLPLIAVRVIYGLFIYRVPVDINTSLGKVAAGYITAPFFIIPLAGSLFGDRLTRWPRRTPVFLGYAFSLAGLVCLYNARGWTGFSASVLCAAMGSAILNPVTNLFAGDLAQGDHLRRVGSTTAFLAPCGIVASLFTSRLVEGRGLYLAVAAALLLSLIPFLRLERLSRDTLRHRVRPPKQP